MNNQKEFMQTMVIRNDDLDDDQSDFEVPPPTFGDGDVELIKKYTASRKPKKKKEEDSGFYRLRRTLEGERRMDEIRRRRQILNGEIPEAKAYGEKWNDFDPTDADRMINEIIIRVQENKYGKGMELRSRTVLDKLIKAFLNMSQLSPNAAKVNAVVKKLIKVCKSYYEYDEHQFLDDDTYDQVVARWRSRGFEEPTGYVPNKSRKTQVRYPLLHNNMDKSYRIYMNDPVPIGVRESDSVEAWLIRSFKTLGINSETVFELEVSPKIDGTSGSGTITAKGRFEDPQTRGDESETLDIRGMDGLELVDSKEIIHPFGIQFEIFVTEEDRVGASAYLEKDPPYVGCRQASSGIVNRLCTGDDNDLLQYISLYPIEASGLDELSYRERMEYLDRFAIVPKDMIHRKILKGTMKQILKDLGDLFSKWEKKREDHSFTYDGMVLTFVDDDYQSILGRQGRTNQYQMALKFDPASAIGIVDGIHLDFGNKGYRTIQVDLDHPVFLDGVRYDHIPVLSAKLFKDLHLRMGDVVRVNRVGDVIPSITVEKNNHGKEITIPTNCPDCGHLLQFRNSKLYCGNPKCASNLSGRVKFFLDALGIDRYGETFADTVVRTFSMEGIRDLFKLTPEAFEKKGITTKDAKMFLTRLTDAMKHTSDYEILGAIGIPDVGKARAHDILKTFGGWDGLIKAFNTSDMCGQLRSAVGDAMGVKIYESLNVRDGWEDLQEDIIGVKPYIKKITDFNAVRTRVGHTGLKKFPEDITKIINDRNFMVVDGKNFDILIAADINSGSAKLEVAKRKNLPVMTLDGFRERYK